MKPTCPKCRCAADLVFGQRIMPMTPVVKHKRFWACVPCKTWVGCHEGTTVPLGTLADKETRRARMWAHSAFDTLWRGGRMARSDAYSWLAKALGVAIDQCHIGQMTIEQCRRVVAVCRKEHAQ